MWEFFPELSQVTVKTKANNNSARIAKDLAQLLVELVGVLERNQVHDEGGVLTTDLQDCRVRLVELGERGPPLRVHAYVAAAASDLFSVHMLLLLLLEQTVHLCQLDLLAYELHLQILRQS